MRMVDRPRVTACLALLVHPALLARLADLALLIYLGFLVYHDLTLSFPHEACRLSASTPWTL